MDVPVGEKDKVACVALFEITRSCCRLSVGRAQPTLIATFAAKTRVLPHWFMALWTNLLSIYVADALVLVTFQYAGRLSFRP